MASSLYHLIKAKWELGLGSLVADQLDQQAYEDLAVVLVVSVFLLERPFPNKLSYATNASAFVPVIEKCRTKRTYQLCRPTHVNNS